jgi:hypothetical protein
MSSVAIQVYVKIQEAKKSPHIAPGRCQPAEVRRHWALRETLLLLIAKPFPARDNRYGRARPQSDHVQAPMAFVQCNGFSAGANLLGPKGLELAGV